MLQARAAGFQCLCQARALVHASTVQGHMLAFVASETNYTSSIRAHLRTRESNKHVLEAELLLLILCYVKHTSQMCKKRCESSRGSVHSFVFLLPPGGWLADAQCLRALAFQFSRASHSGLNFFENKDYYYYCARCRVCLPAFLFIYLRVRVCACIMSCMVPQTYEYGPLAFCDDQTVLKS
ncbi:unnamed protein product [Ixodes pacificus]